MSGWGRLFLMAYALTESGGQSTAPPIRHSLIFPEAKGICAGTSLSSPDNAYHAHPGGCG